MYLGPVVAECERLCLEPVGAECESRGPVDLEGNLEVSERGVGELRSDGEFRWDGARDEWVEGVVSLNDGTWGSKADIVVGRGILFDIISTRVLL